MNSERIQCADLVILECGHVYSKQTIPERIQCEEASLECWYCKDIREGRSNNSCIDYKISKGWVFNDVTGVIRLRRQKDVLVS